MHKKMNRKISKLQPQQAPFKLEDFANSVASPTEEDTLFIHRPGYVNTQLFKTFVQKTKKNIYEYLESVASITDLKKSGIQTLIDLTYMQFNDAMFDMEDGISVPFCIRNEDFKVEYFFEDKSMSEDSNAYERLVFLTSKFLKNYLLGTTKKVTKGYELHNIIEREFVLTCLDWIAEEILISDISENNILIIVPKDPNIQDLFIKRLMTRVVVSVERFVRNESAKKFFAVTEKGAERDNIKLIGSLKEENGKLQKEIKNKEFIISELKRKLDKSNSSKDAEMDELCKENLEKARKIQKLERKVKELENKLNTIQDNQTTTFKNKDNTLNNKDNTLNNKEEITIPEVDVNKRYIFVCAEWSNFENELRNNFPQCEIITNFASIKKMKIDLVVFFSNHISHKLYYGIKKQCKDYNIPYIHCNSTNIDSLKRDISKNHNLPS